MQGRMPLLSPAQSLAKAGRCYCGGQDLLVPGAVETAVLALACPL